MKKHSMCMKTVLTGLLFTFLLLVICSRVCFAAEFSLYLDVEFIGNWIFDTYDVDVYVDDTKIDTIPHGEDYTCLIPDQGAGKHKITFCKANSSGVKGEEIFEMKGDTTFKCTIFAYSSKVQITDVELLDNVNGSKLTVPDAHGRILSAVITDLKETGFKNITYNAKNDTIQNTNNWTVVSQNIQPGETTDKSTNINLTCKSTTGYLREYLLALPAADAADKAKELGFAIGFTNSVTGMNMNERFQSMSDEELTDWRVKSIKAASGGKREAELYMICYGMREVPDVVSRSLSKALEILQKSDYYNVEYVTMDGQGVGNASNWEVLYQSITPGSVRYATDEIDLIVQSLDSIKNEGRVAVKIQDQVSDNVIGNVKESSTEKETEVETDAFETEEPTEIHESIVAETENVTETELETEEIPEINYRSKRTIMAVQEALNKAGYDCGQVDGALGKKTKRMIKKYKKEHDLGNDSKINYRLLKTLGIDIPSLIIEETEVSDTQEKVLQETDNTKETQTVESKTSEAHSVSYSTNDSSTVKNGNSGVYSYKMRGSSYDQYYIIDFDNGYVYYFTNGNGNNTAERVKIESGDLNSVVIITYHDDGISWSYGLHFKYVRFPDTLIVEDNDHFEYKFSATDLDNALRIRDTMNIHDY